MCCVFVKGPMETLKSCVTLPLLRPQLLLTSQLTDAQTRKGKEEEKNKQDIDGEKPIG